MSKQNTDSVAFWKSAFVTLPDSAFFDIVRNYLGDVSTPFNKHRLFDRLVSFLKKRETVRRIISLIDSDDALVNPSHKTLFSTFWPNVSCFDVLVSISKR